MNIRRVTLNTRIALGVGCVMLAGLAFFFGMQSDAPISIPRATVSVASKASTVHDATPMGKQLASGAASNGSSDKRSVGAALVSFGSQSDLWEFAKTALQSSVEANVYEGYAAARECVGFLDIQTDIQSFAADGSNARIGGALTPERQLAIQQLVEKCSGFSKAGAVESRKVLSQFKQRAAGFLGGEFAAERALGKDSSVKDVVPLAYSESPAAMEAGMMPLVSILAANRSAPDPSGAEAKLAGIAALLSVCDLGKDCSKASYSAQLQCALTGKCADRLWSDWDEGLTKEEIARVNAYREQIVSGIRGRDLSRLGSRG